MSPRRDGERGGRGGGTRLAGSLRLSSPAQANARRARDEAELGGATFHPEIDVRSRQLAAGAFASAPTGASDFLVRASRWAEAREQWRQEAAAARREASAAGATWIPEIDGRSRVLAARRVEREGEEGGGDDDGAGRRSGSGLMRCEDRLEARHAAARAAWEARAGAELALREPFHPAITTTAARLEREGSVGARLHSLAAEHAVRREELRRKTREEEEERMAKEAQVHAASCRAAAAAACAAASTAGGGGDGGAGGAGFARRSGEQKQRCSVNGDGGVNGGRCSVNVQNSVKGHGSGVEPSATDPPRPRVNDRSYFGTTRVLPVADDMALRHARVLQASAEARAALLARECPFAPKIDPTSTALEAEARARDPCSAAGRLYPGRHACWSALDGAHAVPASAAGGGSSPASGGVAPGVLQASSGCTSAFQPPITIGSGRGSSPVAREAGPSDTLNPDFCFAPAIDGRSARIDERRQGAHGTERMRRMHARHALKMRRRETAAAELAEQRMAECTFAPGVRRSGASVRAEEGRGMRPDGVAVGAPSGGVTATRGGAAQHHSASPSHVSERCELWWLRREARLEVERQAAAAMRLAGCPFRPNATEPQSAREMRMSVAFAEASSRAALDEATGTADFVARQQQARAAREAARAEQPVAWTGKLTQPVEFCFSAGRAQRAQIRALVSPAEPSFSAPPPRPARYAGEHPDPTHLAAHMQALARLQPPAFLQTTVHMHARAPVCNGYNGCGPPVPADLAGSKLLEPGEADARSGGCGAITGSGPRHAMGRAVEPAPPAPGLERGTSGLDQDTQGIDQSTPGLDQVTPGLDQDTQGIDQSTPGIDQDTPGLDQDTPGLDLGTPGIDQDTPGLDLGTPGIDQDTPGLDQGAPGIDQDTPEQSMPLPHMNGCDHGRDTAHGQDTAHWAPPTERPCRPDPAGAAICDAVGAPADALDGESGAGQLPIAKRVARRTPTMLTSREALRRSPAASQRRPGGGGHRPDAALAATCEQLS
eukprot:scaffold4987_cov91-Isochrysis_galbana.AAC.2